MVYKRWLFIAIFLFAIGLVLGLANSGGIGGLRAEDVAALEALADLVSSLPQSSLLAIIFVKNASVLLISFALSPIFCLVPIMALTFNGWLLGLVIITVIQEKSLGYLIAGLLPHGIFEVPALIIGEAVAFSFGTAVMLALLKKARRNLLLSNLRQNLKYLVVALTLLVPAAVIETYVTPLFLAETGF